MSLQTCTCKTTSLFTYNKTQWKDWNLSKMHENDIDLQCKVYIKLYESHVKDIFFTKNAMLKVADNSFLLLNTCI